MPVSNDLPTVLETLRHAPTNQHVMDVVRTVARALIQSDGISFIRREQDYCYYAEEDAVGALWKGQRFPMEACVSGWVMRHGVPAVIPDIFDDPRVPVDVYRPTFVKSMAMMPVGRPRPVAAIGAYWATPHHATDAELEILQAIADSAAIALADI